MSSVRTPRPLRAVFLDVGETLMRPNPSWEHVYAIAFQEFDVEIDVEALRDALRTAYRHGGWGFESGFEATEEATYSRTVEIDQRAIAELGIGPMPDAFFRRLGELFMVTGHWHIFPDVLPALEQLRSRGLVLGAVSNWVWTLPELLHSLDLVRHLDFVVPSARVGFEKPHPEIFRKALDQARVGPEEALHVGDHIDADVAGAQGVGMAAVLLDRRGRHERAPEGVPLIRSLEELVPIVDVRGVASARAS